MPNPAPRVSEGAKSSGTLAGFLWCFIAFFGEPVRKMRAARPSDCLNLRVLMKTINASQKQLLSPSASDPQIAVPTVSPESLGRAYVALIPQMMGSLRSHLRTLEGGDLRVGQFRMMMAIRMENKPSLSQVAEFVGLTPPSASRVADELEIRGLITRRPDKLDRRRQILSLTAEGIEVLEMVKRTAETHFAGLFCNLTPAERSFLLCAADTLRPLFRVGPVDPPAVLASAAGRADIPPTTEKSKGAG